MSKNTVKIAGPNWLQMAAADLQQVQPQTAVADTQQPATRKRATMIRRWREGDHYYREYANLLVARFDKDKRLIQVMEKFLLDNRVMERVFLQPDWATWVNPNGTAYYEDCFHVWLYPTGRVIRSFPDGRLYKYETPQPRHQPTRESAKQPLASPTEVPRPMLPGLGKYPKIQENLDVFAYTSKILGKMLKPEMFAVVAQVGRAYLVQYEPRMQYEPKLPFLIIPGLLEQAGRIDGMSALVYVRSRYDIVHSFLTEHSLFYANRNQYNNSQFLSAMTAAQKITTVYEALAKPADIMQDELDFLRLHLTAAVSYPEAYTDVVVEPVKRQWDEF